MSFAVPEDTTPDDMIVAVRARDADAVTAALAALEAALAAAPAEGGGALEPPAPRTVGTAAARIGADLALVSVPGPHAYVEAAEALDRGCHVMVFSDNVSST
jgi:FdrA protein